MSIPISDNMKNMKPSIIREILKGTQNPNTISFAAGNPAAEAFDTELIAKITEELLKNDPISMLQYSVSEGLPQLRQEIINWLTKDHICCDNNSVLVTTGAEQALDLICKVLCNKGDYVLAERPSFVGALNTFRSYGVNLCDVPMEEDGMNLDILEQQLKKYRPKFIYIIPNFQNPTGYVTSLQKRKAILQLAYTYQCAVVEDNPYGELRFSGNPVPTIKSMDTKNQVIYVGSFSKILAPGIRVGYLLAPNEIFGALTVGKQCTDVHTTTLAQGICLKFLQKVDIPSYTQKLSKVYQRKATLMMNALQQECGELVHFAPVTGGMFLWLQLPEEIDMLSFCAACAQKGVMMVPGNALYCDDTLKSNCVRLNYSTPTDEQIVRGVQIMAQVLKEIANKQKEK